MSEDDGNPFKGKFNPDLDNSDASMGQHLINFYADEFARVVDTNVNCVWREKFGVWSETVNDDRMRQRYLSVTDRLRSRAKVLQRAAEEMARAADEDDTDRQREVKEAQTQAKKLDAWVTSARQETHIRGGIKSALAHPDVRTTSGQWNANPNLLNVGNGTLHLGEDGSVTFREHRRDDWLTQAASVHYVPEATAPLWQEFLDWAIPDPDMQRVVRALAGITLLGHNGHQLIPLLHGRTRSGKSTLINILCMVLSHLDEPGIGYAGLIAVDDLRAKRNGGGPDQTLMALVGKRIASLSEPDDDAPLSAGVIKRMAGADPSPIRDAHKGSKDLVCKEATFTPWLSSNEIPVINKADEALMERIILIPMNAYRDGMARDPRFANKVAATEGSGILNWMLRGYQDAIAHPEVLRELPQVCRIAKVEALAAMSLPRSWLARQTAPCGCLALEKPGCSKCLTVKKSWEMFQAWCRERDYKTGGERTFGNAMKAAGYEGEPIRIEAARGKTRVARVRLGLTCSAEYLDDQADQDGALRVGDPDSGGGMRFPDAQG